MRHQRRQERESGKDRELLNQVIEHSSIFILRKPIDGKHLGTCKNVMEYLSTSLPSSLVFPLSDLVRRQIGTLCHVINCRCEKEQLILPIQNTYPRLAELGQHVTKELFQKHGVAAVLTCASYDETIPGIIDSLLSLDMIYLVTYTEDAIIKVVQRCTFLKTEHPRIWSLVETDYTTYFNRIYEAAQKSKISIDLLWMCLSIVPDAELEIALDEKDNLFRLSSFTPSNIVHLLGVSSLSIEIPRIDILHHTVNPSCRGDLAALPELPISKPQIGELQLRIININRLKLELFKLECELIYENVSVVNDNTTSGDPVEEYPPSDIFHYCTADGKIFQFVASELQSILKSGKNLYTNQELDCSFLDLIELPDFYFDSNRSAPVSQMIEDVVDPITPLCQILRSMNKEDNVKWTMLTCGVGPGVDLVGQQIAEEFRDLFRPMTESELGNHTSNVIVSMIGTMFNEM